jgi:MFS family permease
MREDSVIEDGSSFQESNDALSFTDYKYFYLFTIIPLCIANFSDATEILCLSYILSDSTFQSTVLLGSSGGTLAGAIFAGMLLGGILIVILGEAPIDICNTKSILVGRRRPWILAINSIAGFASAFASNALSMTIIRSIAGFGIGISVPPLFTLVAELSPPQIRGVIVSLVASFWMIGRLFVSLVALLIFTHGTSDQTLPAWRVFAMICAIPSFVAFILVFIFIPESPRYLSLHHKWDEAQKAHATLVSRSPTLIFDFVSVDPTVTIQF